MQQSWVSISRPRFEGVEASRWRLGMRLQDERAELEVSLQVSWRGISGLAEEASRPVSGQVISTAASCHLGGLEKMGRYRARVSTIHS